jgi:putative tryptophan/tyrosine transport system substrate-binding protein
MILLIFLISSFLLNPNGVAEASTAKHRILVISSYHKEYLWSQDTNRGVCAALLDFGYLDNNSQVEAFKKNDNVETSIAVIKKLWMDTKRRNSRQELAKTTGRIVSAVDLFKPDIILLGDDNATNYIGNYYLDTKLPIVFWGLTGVPPRYGLLDSINNPGHNITGIYQAGYLKEGVEFLVKLLPHVKTLAILSDKSPTGRRNIKILQKLAQNGKLPIKIVGIVVTNDLVKWKTRALELEKAADAFFVLNHNTIKDEHGNPVPQLQLGAWYLRNINKPDIGHERQFVVEGLLSVVDDSGFKQGYEAVRIANRIIRYGANPAFITSYAPERGKFIINLERAKMLGLESLIKNSSLVEGTIDRALALEAYP